MGKGKPCDAPEHRGEDHDDCPICCEPLGREKLTVCRACRNAVHEECFRQWARVQGSAITCPICRTSWKALSAKQGGKAVASSMGREGFLNLASQAGLST